MKHFIYSCANQFDHFTTIDYYQRRKLWE